MAKIDLQRREQIGQQKKERTRRTIVEAAYRLFAKHGFDAPTTDDIVAEAGIARGTLYAHFATKEDIMRCVALDFANSIEEGFTRLLADVGDPVQRIALRVRFLCDKAVQTPTWGWLIIRVIPTGPLGTESRRGFLRDLTLGQESGKLSLRSEQSALDMIQGAVIMGVRTMLSDPNASPGHVDDIVITILRGLGLSAARAAQMAAKAVVLEASVQAAGPTSNVAGEGAR